MVDLAKVSLFGRTMGILRWDNSRNVALFQYDNTFVRSGLNPSPIMMPARSGVVYSFGSLSEETFKGLPGTLADSLPDSYGRALFDKWLQLNGRQDANAIETLCFMGKRCMGALEFEPMLDSGKNFDQNIEINTLVQVAQEALSDKSAFSANLQKKDGVAEILRLGTSAGGQRAKAIIAYNKATGEVRSGQVDAPEGFEHYIIKLDGVSAEVGAKATQNYGLLEYSFYKLAQKCGIEMTECSIFKENDRAHFLTKRFDRIGGRKLHMQTLCGIAHYDFRLHHAYSYEQAFSVMRALRLPYAQAQEMFRRMVFNVVVRNQDDHTKNISFLMNEEGEWRLSPAYDMGYAYNPQGAWTATHQMSINGKFDNITREDLLACARANNIRNASEIIDHIIEAASTWPTLAAESNFPPAQIEAIVPNLLLEI